MIGVVDDRQVRIACYIGCCASQIGIAADVDLEATQEQSEVVFMRFRVGFTRDILAI